MASTQNDAVITSPDDPLLNALCERLRELAPTLDRTRQWPARQLQLCADYGVFQWFVDPQFGGQGWSQRDCLNGYLALSAACLTTTFIITQRTGACTRLATSENTDLAAKYLPSLARGESFATVGISHLTTSGRHLAQPLLRAYPESGQFRLEGLSPWVTGGCHARQVVVGAVVMDGQRPTESQLLALVGPRNSGFRCGEPAELTALTASHTGPVHADALLVEPANILAGPTPNVMSAGGGGTTGGLQTSTLALGVSQAAIDFLGEQAAQRAELEDSQGALQTDFEQVRQLLFDAADERPNCSKEELRIRANSLALRSTQAALAAAKGAGYVIGHPAGRWCREALFFLVWSCPQPVVAGNLCELAGILD